MPLTLLETSTVALALAGPAAIGLIGSRPGARATGLPLLLFCQGLLVALGAVCLWVTLVPLGRDPSALGILPPGWGTLFCGGAIAALFVLVVGPLLLRLPGWLGLQGFGATLGGMAKLPVWYLGLAVIVGGTVEELLYRGVALGILIPAGVAPAIAAAVVIVAFALAHLPMWGPGPALTTALSGSCLTLFFLLHGDLLANVLAHVATDFVGIVLGPLVATLRRQSK
jgi:membrane protease YdiL (CAAX protease family)